MNGWASAGDDRDDLYDDLQDRRDQDCELNIAILQGLGE